MKNMTYDYGESQKMSLIEELLFTTGSWLGFLLLVLTSFLLIKIYRYTSIISSVIFTLIGIEYYTRYSGGTTDYLWFWILSWAMPILLVLAMLKMRR